MRPLSFTAGLFLFILASGTLHAAPQRVGSAVVVVNLVTAAYNRDTRTLQNGDRVNQDETIEVGLDGSSELKLDDDTKLALGPGSHLTLDKFVYDADKAAGSIVLDLVKGTFRFMTGVAEKPTYVIKTPAAAITVRGTIFDVYVQDNGMSWLLLHEGAIQVCNQRGQCKTLDEPGKLIRIGEDGGVGNPVKWASLQGKDSVPFDSAFPFVVKAPSIDPKPIFTRDVIVLGTLPDPDKPKTDGKDPKKRGETTKPTKKRAEKATETKTKDKKRARTAKKRDSGDDNIVDGMDIVIGIGGGMGRHRPGGGMGPKGGGDHGRGMGGGGRKH